MMNEVTQKETDLYQFYLVDQSSDEVVEQEGNVCYQCGPSNKSSDARVIHKGNVC